MLKIVLFIFSHLCWWAEMTHTISENMSVHPTVRPSVHNQTQCSHKPVCDIGRGRQDMRYDMTFKVIRHLFWYSEYCCWLLLYWTISKFFSGRISHFRFGFRIMGLQIWLRMHFLLRSDGCKPVTESRERDQMVSSSAVFRGILNIIDDYDTMEQYLNFFRPDIPLPLSFSFYRTSNLIQNAYFYIRRL